MIHASISALTLEEKAGLASGGSFWGTRVVEHAGIASVTVATSSRQRSRLFGSILDESVVRAGAPTRSTTKGLS